MQSYTVNPGTYSFSERHYPSWHVASIDCLPANAVALNLANRSVTINATAGATITCTFVNQRRSNIQAIKFNDLDSNALYTAGEPLLPGWSIRLYSESNSLLAHAVTNATGQVSFANRAPTTYKLCEEQQAGWSNSLPGQIDPVINQPCYLLALTPGVNADVLFGNHQRAPVALGINSASIGISVTPLEDINEEPTANEAIEAGNKVFMPLVVRE